MSTRRTVPAWMVALGVLLASVAGQPTAAAVAPEPALIIFAAAGATDVVTRLADQYEAERGVEVKLNFASSSTLARQIEAGAKADIFISANTQWMDYVQDRQLLAAGSRVDLAANRLVLVVPQAAAAQIHWRAGEDLAAAVAGKIAIGDPTHVPAGIYTKQALESAGCYDALMDRFVACPSVRAALRLVEDGHVEAGIVYKSDAAASQRVAVVETLPSQWHEPITFQMALLRDSHPSAAVLAAFLAGPQARTVLAQFGFDDLAEPTIDQVVGERVSVPFWRLGAEERSALLISLKVALASVALLLAPGILLGFVLARKSFIGKSVLEGLVHAPLVLPPVVTGYLLLLLLGNNGVLGRWLHQTYGIEFAFTFKAAAIASAVVALPLMVRSVRVAVTAADRGLEQASSMLGAGPLKTFFLVSLPLAAPGVLAGLVLAFARSLGEFGATAVFMGNIEGQRTLPLAIYASLQTAHGESFAWRLVTVSVVVSVIALIASEVLARRAARYMEPNDAS